MPRSSTIAVKAIAAKTAAKVIPLLKFFRFQNHHNFITVIAGTAFFSVELSFRVVEDLLAQYLIFGLLLYGGIYTFNGITDADSDREHPRKRSRPIPSGVISKPEAVRWMSFLWIAAFGLSYAYEQSFRFWTLYLAFISVNLFYSLYLRGTAYRYLIGITCPMRLYLGASLVDAEVPWTAYAIAFCFMSTVQALKIRLEYPNPEDWHRSPIPYLLLSSGVLFWLQFPENGYFLFFLGLTYLIFLLIPSLFPQAGVQLFGADVTPSKQPPFWAAIALSLLKRQDYLSLLSFLLLSVLAALNRLLIALEDRLFPQLSRIPLDRVVWILGHQRSGTTYLHKALHQHREITTSCFYDLWFSSLILKRIGAPFKPLLNRLTHHWSTPNHPLNLDEELEEYFWLMLRFKSLLIPSMFPSLMNDVALVNRCMEYTDADIIFLKKCLQRVLYHRPTSQLYIGRPLTLTAHPHLLQKHFPTATLLLCIRDPSQCMISWTDQTAKVARRSPSVPLIRNFMQHLYLSYSQSVFENLEKFLSDEPEPAQKLVYPILFEALKYNTTFQLKEILLALKLDPHLLPQIVPTRTEQHNNRPESDQVVVAQSTMDSYARVKAYCETLDSASAQSFPIP